MKNVLVKVANSGFACFIESSKSLFNRVSCVPFPCRINYGFILMFLVLLFVSCTRSAIYVTSKGDDKNFGTRSKPVASIDRAVEISRLSKAKKIIVGEGSYYDVSVTLTPVDSGLIISGEQGEKVLLNGGKALTNWTNEGDWFVADVPGSRNRSWDFRILIVNDSLRPRARLPETGGFLHQTKWPYSWQSSQGGWSKKPTVEELTTLIYNPDDLGSWLDVRNAELTVFHMWNDSYVGLQSMDTIKHSVTFSSPASHPAGAWGTTGSENAGSRYIVWNIREGMKHPGQWYLDRSKEKLFYWPYAYEKISDFKAFIPDRNQIILLEKGVRNITLENLDLSCANAPMARTTNLDGAILAPGISHLAIRDVNIKNVAGCGIRINGSDISVTDCEIAFTGTTGINYRGKNIHIERCGIHDMGNLLFGAVGINGAGEHNIISHCELYNIPYCAINGVGSGSVAEYNLIYNFKLVMKDGGGIYCFTGDSTIYRHNAVLLDRGNNTIEGRSFYFDEMSKNCIMENNLAVNTLYPVHLHMANETIIRNNIFIDQSYQGINYRLSSNARFYGNTFVADTISFNGPVGEPFSDKEKKSLNPVFLKYDGANGITEFQNNILVSQKTLQRVQRVYSTNRIEDFNLRDSRHVSGLKERNLLQSTIPEGFGQSGYRNNFSEIFIKLNSKKL